MASGRDQLVGKVRESLCLLEDLAPDQVQGLGMEKLKSFLQEWLLNAYDLKEGQIDQQHQVMMREGGPFLHFSADRCSPAGTFFGDGRPAGVSCSLLLWPKRSSD